MENFLICQNPKCRFVIDLGKNGHGSRLQVRILHQCPDCGHPWSSACPFCSHPLQVAWPDKLPHCSSCHRKLQAEAA